MLRRARHGTHVGSRKQPLTNLPPAGEAREALTEDYQRIVEDRLRRDHAESFNVWLERCHALVEKVKGMVSRSP